jgi:large subunit ribosomal protein L6
MNTIYTSRVGRKPITVPAGVDVKVSGDKITAKGPKGQHSIPVHPYVSVNLQDGTISVVLNDKSGFSITGPKTRLYKSIAGTQRANINNMIYGVHTGFERKLVLVGVGYRAASKGKMISLSLGYSHPTDFAVPEGVTIETPSQTEIIVKGVNKEQVGLVASQIREMRGPEPYKGKGVRYSDEVVEIKETKKK